MVQEENFQPQIRDTSNGPHLHTYIPRSDGSILVGGVAYIPQSVPGVIAATTVPAFAQPVAVQPAIQPAVVPVVTPVGGPSTVQLTPQYLSYPYPLQYAATPPFPFCQQYPTASVLYVFATI